MAKFTPHHIAIYNFDKHFVEGIETEKTEAQYRLRLELFKLQCMGYGYHLGYAIYDSTVEPFSWEAVTPKPAEAPVVEEPATEEPVDA